MYLLDISYVAPIETIEKLQDDHVSWLKQGRANGLFLAWGRKVPRTGGLVFAVGTREEVEAEAQRDPFVSSGAARVAVIEFAPSYAGEGLEGLNL